MEKYYLALRAFILYNAYYLMHDQLEIPNIYFDFKEEKARQEIIDLINNEINLKYLEEDKLEQLKQVIEGIMNPDYEKNVIEINNYKAFFTYLQDVLDQTPNKEEMLKYIWLRMTPDDFKNPEDFLRKSANILKNRTLDDIQDSYIEDNPFFKDNPIEIKIRKSHAYNESMQEIVFKVYENLTPYTLPIIRYGIYEKNNELVCEIGSIQNIDNKYVKNDATTYSVKK